MIWQEYMVNPNESRVRVLAQRHGLSIARVDAILRLKGLEEHWIKVRHSPPSPNPFTAFVASRDEFNRLVLKIPCGKWLDKLTCMAF